MFVPGQIYRRRDIHAQYGGQQQGGISTPTSAKAIFLFTGQSGNEYGYNDVWTDDGMFLYTGEGQRGDMEFVRGNAAILRHQENDEELHLFEDAGVGSVRYIGQMVCTGFRYRQAKDQEQVFRKVIVFELVPMTIEGAINWNEDSDAELGHLYQRAIQDFSEYRTPIERRSLYRQRSDHVKKYVHKRANGICEGCGQDAPFLTASNEPFLEVHHVYRLSDDGPDHPASVVALCPNCHRRAHYANDSDEFNSYLQNKVRELEHVL